MLLSIPGKAQSLLNIRDEAGTEAMQMMFVSGVEALASERTELSQYIPYSHQPCSAEDVGYTQVFTNLLNPFSHL